MHESGSDLDGKKIFSNPLEHLKKESGILFSYLNINSIKNKRKDVKSMILPNVDILCIAETKLDSSFPESKLLVEGFKKPIRLDFSKTSGGLLLYVKDHLPLRQLSHNLLSPGIECLTLELNLRKSKWLILSIYRNPRLQKLKPFLEELTKVLDHYGALYENLLIFGDFNEEISQTNMSNFLDSFSLKNLIKNPTCFKSIKGRCIDLILTNRPLCFKKTGSFETGISDYHHLIYSMFKASFKKAPPKIIEYRSFRKFDETCFRSDLSRNLDCDFSDFESFSNTFENILDAHAPMKKRTIRGNQKPHITKAVRKAIMVRSFYKNKANKTGNPFYKNLYRKQKNYIVNLNRKAKRKYFRDLGTSENFWKSAKPYFSKKVQHHEKIFLLDDSNELIDDEATIAETFNDYFVNIASYLGLKTSESSLPEDPEVDPHENHPSILRILESMSENKSFSFSEVTPEDIHGVMLKLNQDKSVSGPFSTKLVKMVSDILSGPLSKLINLAFTSSEFPQSLKKARVTPVYKKEDKFLKKNYRPISILPVFSKIYERIIHDQLSSYFDSIFDSRLCGFRAKHSTQHALIKMIGQWHQSLDTSGKVGAVLMDLSKAFDCIDHKLLLAKLKAYGLDTKSLDLLKCYLSNRYQRTKIGSQYSEWLEITLGVPQGSILGPLLFNIFINDLFLFIVKASICNFADDNTLHSCAETLAEVISNLEFDLEIILVWFSNNYLEANPGKFQMLVLGARNTVVEISVGNVKISPTDSVELLGIIIDKDLSFSAHINSLCSIARSRIWSLNRIRNLLIFDQRKLIFNAYVMSIFNYAPIIWMFCNKTTYEEITKVHKRALRILLCDFQNNYECLLQIAECKTVHEIHLRFLLCEVYKSQKKLNPEFMQEVYASKTIKFNLRNKVLMSIPKATSQRFGTQSFLFRGSLLWNQISESIKLKPSIESFKSQLKKENLSNTCLCKICT